LQAVETPDFLMYETPDGRRFIGRQRVVLGVDRGVEGYLATLKTLEERNKKK
jgi:hypothetical protein